MLALGGVGGALLPHSFFPSQWEWTGRKEGEGTGAQTAPVGEIRGREGRCAPLPVFLWGETGQHVGGVLPPLFPVRTVAAFPPPFTRRKTSPLDACQRAGAPASPLSPRGKTGSKKQGARGDKGREKRGTGHAGGRGKRGWRRRANSCRRGKERPGRGHTRLSRVFAFHRSKGPNRNGKTGGPALLSPAAGPRGGGTKWRDVDKRQGNRCRPRFDSC